LSGEVMARQLREAYKPLFAANEYAWKLDKKDLLAKLKNVTGAGDDDPNLPNVVGTFIELSKLAKWDGTGKVPEKREETLPAKNGRDTEDEERRTTSFGAPNRRLGLSYTINLNLPATTEIEVFNAIFKSLRDNLLRTGE
jgi:hypothetical protein